jgi:hypothetical protein
MTKTTMEKLQLPNLHQTPRVLQLANMSTIKLEGVSRYNLGGYPLILGRPWLLQMHTLVVNNEI